MLVNQIDIFQILVLMYQAKYINERIMHYEQNAKAQKDFF